MALPLVLNSQFPSRARRDSMFAGPDTDDELEPISSVRPSAMSNPREMAMLESMLGGTSLAGLPVRFGGCRPSRTRDRVPKKVPLNDALRLLSGLCNCGSCPECRRARRDRKSLRDPIMKPLRGPASPSPAYLRAAAVPSRPAPSDHPLVVISLDGVVDARLPYHLAGGYTDVLSRPYLETFLAYLLSQSSPWSFCFYSSLTRKEALKTLRSLNMPTGGPEKDERDGVVGLFARDDMREGWEGGELELKDLEVIWSELYKEEGVQWGVEDTVVLTDFPGHMKLQPSSFIYVPQILYKSMTRPRDDQFLLLMIAVLKDLETETNFAYHIRDMEWHKPDIWTSLSEKATNERNAYLLNAVRICADYRIDIKAFTGNKHK